MRDYWRRFLNFKLKPACKRFNKREEGLEMVEYAIITSAVVVVFAAAYVYIGEATSRRIDIAGEMEESFVPCVDGVTDLLPEECF